MPTDEFARYWTVFLERNLSFIAKGKETRRKIRLDELYPRALVNALISNPPILTINITEFHIPNSTRQKQKNCRCVLVVYSGDSARPLIRQQHIATFLPLDENTFHVQIHDGPFKISMVDLQCSTYELGHFFTLNYPTYIYFFPLQGHDWLVPNNGHCEMEYVNFCCDQVTGDLEQKQIITQFQDQKSCTLVDLESNQFQRRCIVLDEGQGWTSPNLYMTVTASWSKRLRLQIKPCQPQKCFYCPPISPSWVRWHYDCDKIQLVQGFRCPICVGRDYGTVEILERHFNQYHDYFKTCIKQLNSPDMVDIHVDIDGEYMERRTSQKIDPLVFGFIKKKTEPVPNEIPRSNVAISKKRRIRIVPLVGDFYDSRTKRKFEPGEQVEESEDDIDMGWYIQKQNEELDEFSDVTQSEKDFMKLWTSFISLIIPRSKQDLAECLIRFCKEKRKDITANMFQTNILIMLMNLIDHRRVDPETVFRVGQLLQSDEKEVSSVKETLGSGSVMACCTLPWKRGDIMFCSNMGCENPYYHKSCQVSQDPRQWKCPRYFCSKIVLDIKMLGMNWQYIFVGSSGKKIPPKPQYINFRPHCFTMAELNDGSTCSVRTAFDEWSRCYSIANLSKSYYRYGIAPNCSQKWDELKFCFLTRFHTQEEQKEMFRRHRIEKLARKKKGRASEEIWQAREGPGEYPFTMEITDYMTPMQ